MLVCFVTEILKLCGIILLFIYEYEVCVHARAHAYLCCNWNSMWFYSFVSLMSMKCVSACVYVCMCACLITDILYIVVFSFHVSMTFEYQNVFILTMICNVCAVCICEECRCDGTNERNWERKLKEKRRTERTCKVNIFLRMCDENCFLYIQRVKKNARECGTECRNKYYMELRAKERARVCVFQILKTNVHHKIASIK